MGHTPAALEETGAAGAAAGAGAENCAGPHLRAPELRTASWGSAGCENAAAAAAAVAWLLLLLLVVTPASRPANRPPPSAMPESGHAPTAGQ